MESVEARIFIDNCQQSADTETRARGRNVEVAMGGIRSRVEIVFSGGADNALAFVEANNDNVAYLSYETTGDKDTTKHALLHEDDHNRLKFWDLPLTDNFTQDHADILAEGVGLSLAETSENIGLMEGFHEMLTIERDGVDQDVGYNAKEVPAAQKLERLGQQVLGVSLYSIYKSGNHDLMAQTLKNLADRCLLLKSASEITDVPERLQVEARLQSIEISITNIEKAESVVDQIRAEIIAETMTQGAANTNKPAVVAA
jgi:hypothetical protein